MSVNVLKRLFHPDYLVKKDKRLGDVPGGRDAYRNVLRIALPSVAEMVFVSLIGSVDMMMVGNVLGAGAINSTGLPTQPRMLMLCMFFALNVGVTSIVARRKGEQRQDEANNTLRNAMMIVIGMALLLGSLALVFAEPLLKLAGGDPVGEKKIFDDAVTYFRIMTYALPVDALAMCICAAQRGVGNTKITMRVRILSNLVNVFFNFCLIGGNLGFPSMGVEGAAWASLIGLSVGFLLALGTVLVGGRHKGYLHISIHDKWRFEKDTMKAITKVSGNAAVEQLGVRFGFFVYARILFSLGTEMYAANQICMQLLNLTFTFGDGLGVAGTALVGQNLGAKRWDLSMLYGKICQRYALIVSVIIGTIIVIFRYPLASLYIGANTQNADVVVRYAAETMLVLAAIQPFQISSVVLSGSLRGAGDNLYVAAVATMCVSIVRPIMAFLAVNVFAFNSLSITWIFGLSEIVLRFLFFYPRFASGKWKDKKV